ncbi:MAG TPA: glycosyltransferase [Candidatus Dormibacteraeota bacterium]|jgi:glycosyltransferase involved in cell wall biosynthesis|nr:glycosyltransferase [Candidatus Dormibacteraeota bacterium]
MKTLLVTPYPPARDGLAAYALQLAGKMRADGEIVDVISPAPSGARYHANFLTLRGRVKLARIARRYDRVLVQYHPFFFFGSSSRVGYLTDILSLLLLFTLGRRVEVYVHEVDYASGSRRALAPLWRLVWHAPERVYTHTAQEHDDMLQAFRLSADRVRLIQHGESFIARASMTRARAREGLGIDAEAFVFLSIGFLQPHKGFDRAVRAFAELNAWPGAEIYVVGSVRVPSPEHSAYVDGLRRLVDRTPGAHLRESFVSDALFDRWILAADVVVLPYRAIWSSGVVERAALLGRSTIVTDVGGLPHQARADTVVVKDEGELIAALAKACAAPVPEFASAAMPTTPAAAAQWVTDRGRRMRLWDDGMSTADVADGLTTAGAPVIGRLAFPLEPNARGAKRRVLRAAGRLTRWQLMPVVAYVNRLREVMLTADVDQRSEPGSPDDS